MNTLRQTIALVLCVVMALQFAGASYVQARMAIAGPVKAAFDMVICTPGGLKTLPVGLPHRPNQDSAAECECPECSLPGKSGFQPDAIAAVSADELYRQDVIVLRWRENVRAARWGLWLSDGACRGPPVS